MSQKVCPSYPAPVNPFAGMARCSPRTPAWSRWNRANQMACCSSGSRRLRRRPDARTRRARPAAGRPARPSRRTSRWRAPKVSPHAERWTWAVCVRTPSRSNKQARMPSGRPSIRATLPHRRSLQDPAERFVFRAPDAPSQEAAAPFVPSVNWVAVLERSVLRLERHQGSRAMVYSTDPFSSKEFLPTVIAMGATHGA